MDYHQRMTSLGTKRGVSGYWRQYRRGKEKALACPFHDICLELAFKEKRRLYIVCPQCKHQEGYPRANFMADRHYSYFKYSGGSYYRKQGTFQFQLKQYKKRIMTEPHQTEETAEEAVKWILEDDRKFREKAFARIEEMYDDDKSLFENLQAYGFRCPDCQGEISEEIDPHDRHKILCKKCGKVIAQCL